MAEAHDCVLQVGEDSMQVARSCAGAIRLDWTALHAKGYQFHDLYDFDLRDDPLGTNMFAYLYTY